MNQKISVVITDLDNTLYDWVEMWYRAFSGMLDYLVKESGIDQQILESEIRTIFQEHKTSEYAFLIQEIPSLQKKHPNEDLLQRYAPAREAYNKARNATMELYPLVEDTLKKLKTLGCLIVGYTESRSYYTLMRIKKLNLDGIIDYIYSPPDHKKPENLYRSRSEEAYRLIQTIHHHTEEDQTKPNKEVLLKIIKDIGAIPENTIYIGDNLMKDIYMAQQANITDVFAKYGAAQDREEYELLRRVSHWKQKDVDHEKIFKIHPSYILENNFSEILDIFNFIPFSKK